MQNARTIVSPYGFALAYQPRDAFSTTLSYDPGVGLAEVRDRDGETAYLVSAAPRVLDRLRSEGCRVEPIEDYGCSPLSGVGIKVHIAFDESLVFAVALEGDFGEPIRGRKGCGDWF